jgi:hypothetical protein
MYIYPRGCNGSVCTADIRRQPGFPSTDQINCSTWQYKMIIHNGNRLDDESWEPIMPKSLYESAANIACN